MYTSVVKGAALALGLLCSTSVAADELQRLIESEQYAAAYELAQRQVDARIGNPQFDFLYGLAALESGKPSEAVFAFERVLEEMPEDHRARLELARAYFALGDMERSRQLFERVKASQPPPRVESNIQLFLDQIEDYKQGVNSRFDLAMTLSLGMDSNVNSATDLETVDAYFGPIQVSMLVVEESRASDDTFMGVGIDANYLHLINKRLAWFTGVDLNVRHNFDIDQYDTRQLALEGGIAWQWGKHSFRMPLQFQRLDVDQLHFRDLTTVGLEWNKQIDTDQWALFTQVGDMKYPDQESRDANLAILGGAWSTPLANWPVTMLTSLYLGQEDPKQKAGAFHGRQYLGMRVGAMWHLGVDYSINLSANLQTVEHDAIHPWLSLIEVREDDLIQVSFSWQWQVRPQWLLSVNFDHMNNDSNFELYSYSRAQQYVTLKYQF